MSAIWPQSWAVALIGEIANLNPRLDKSEIASNLEVSFVPMPAVGAESGKIDVSARRRFSEVEKGYTGFKQGDVLFAKITPCMENGKMAVVPEVHGGLGFGSTEFHVLRPTDGIVAEYVYYFVSSKRFRADAEHHMTGAVGQRRVPTTYLSQSEIPLPPHAEQRRIVEKIEELFSELDKGIENLKQARAQLAVYRQALLKHAFEGKLTTDWRAANADKLESAEELLARILEKCRQDWIGRGKFVKQADPDTTNLSKLPEKWVWTNVGQLRVFSFYGPRFSSDDYAEDGYFVLRTSDISESGKVNTAEAPRLKLSKDEFERYRARRGDLLITRTGSLGTLAVFDDDVEAIPGAYLIQFRLATDNITTRYLFYFLKSPVGQNYLTGKGAGVGRPNLNAPTIEALAIPLPPLAEQDQILSELDAQIGSIEALESDIDANLQKAEALRQSTLKKAFSGELVPQDPDDEPASVLLARIRTERAGVGAPARGKRKPNTP